MIPSTVLGTKQALRTLEEGRNGGRKVGEEGGRGGRKNKESQCSSDVESGGPTWI